MRRHGLQVPGGLCVLTHAYDRFVDSAGLRRAVALELGRKAFEDMRWEEIWDASLRIRNLFLRASIEPTLGGELEDALRRRFWDGRAAVVRSSAPAEDTASTSFAGLHESYVDVRGVAALVDAVRRVWASLWTDRALLYRQELGLDVMESSMAVVVQELVSGQVSGVAFSRNPLEESQAVVESVWGLNEGLVDGTIEPDRWIIDRATGDVVESFHPLRRQKVVPGIASRAAEGSGVRSEGDSGTDDGAAAGTRLVPLSAAEQATAPLSASSLRDVFAAALAAEDLFGAPQDVEWTIAEGELYVLQSRPISTLGSRFAGEADVIAHERAHEEVGQIIGATVSAEAGQAKRDERPWYLNLQRSFSTLVELRRQVEEVTIPRMAVEADSLASVDLASLSDADLDVEIARRTEALTRWEEVYYRDFIPLAHGVRLFGQVYNDKVRPNDPYEFVDLLSGSGLLSVSRNAALRELADRVRDAMRGEPGVLGHPAAIGRPEAVVQSEALDRYLDRFGSGPGAPEPVRVRERAQVLRLVTQMAQRLEGTTDSSVETVAISMGASGSGRTQAATGPETPAVDRVEAYLSRFQGDERRFQKELVDLARASYRLRDDDNLYLGRFRRLVESALAERGTRRGASPLSPDPRAGGAGLEEAAAAAAQVAATRFRVRQLVGQPAGAGVAVGRARVVLLEEDLYAFQRGEVLVCDSLDPSMTFVAPLAAAVVERRGGMLVHGAIIAREYGLPCVTGVPDATIAIHTGDLLTVDGSLGVVVVGGAPPGVAHPGVAHSGVAPEAEEASSGDA
jgi:pyruvate,water dikinase